MFPLSGFRVMRHQKSAKIQCNMWRDCSSLLRDFSLQLRNEQRLSNEGMLSKRWSMFVVDFFRKDSGLDGDVHVCVLCMQNV